MPTQTRKAIFILGDIVTDEQFCNDFNKYFPYIKNKFRQVTLDKQHVMSQTEFANHIFNKCYRKNEFSVELNLARAEENKMLSAIGINVVSYSPSKANITFEGSDNSYNIKSSDLDNLISSIKKNIKYTKSSFDISFGVELEFIADYNCRRQFNHAMYELFGGKYEDLGRYNHNQGDKWILGRDISVRSRSRGYSGFELTSPILHWNEKDLNELKTVINLIKDIFHGEVNKTCGTHIHMSFNCNRPITEHLCKHFARSYARNEKDLFDKLVPLYRREDKSRWCQHTSVIYYNRSRYQKLNFTHVSYFNNNSNLHLEFRQLDGTLDFNKIKSWIKLQRLFAMIALKSYNENHTELRDCIHDVVKMPIEEIVCSHEFTNTEVESLLKEAALIS